MEFEDNNIVQLLKSDYYGGFKEGDKAVETLKDVEEFAVLKPNLQKINLFDLYNPKMTDATKNNWIKQSDLIVIGFNKNDEIKCLSYKQDVGYRIYQYPLKPNPNKALYQFMSAKRIKAKFDLEHTQRGTKNQIRTINMHKGRPLSVWHPNIRYRYNGNKNDNENEKKLKQQYDAFIKLYNERAKQGNRNNNHNNKNQKTQNR